MTNRQFLQMVSLAPSPKNEDGCSCVIRVAQRSILLFWGNTSEIYAAYVPGKFIQPPACGSGSGGESSPQDCNNPSPNRDTQPHKGVQLSPASATTVWMLWEVMRSGSSTPLTPHIRKLSDLSCGVEIVASPVLSGSVCSVTVPCRPKSAKVYFHGQVGASLSKMFQYMQVKKENFLFSNSSLFHPAPRENFSQRETRQCWEESHGDQCKRHR